MTADSCVQGVSRTCDSIIVMLRVSATFDPPACHAELISNIRSKDLEVWLDLVDSLLPTRTREELRLDGITNV